MNNTVTVSHIIEGFAQLGVQPTSHVMVHASLSRFGQVDGGAQTVVAALRAAAGDDGAVIAPSFRGSIRADNYALRECTSVCPRAFCPSKERGETGIIGETIREQPDALRSCHPTHSWAGIGAGAEFLLEGHRNSPTPCGTDSPFFRLLQREGVILLLGVGVNSLTNVHAVEDARNVAYLSAIDPPRRHATYTTSGRRIQYCYPELLHRALDEAGIIRSIQIGGAMCHVLNARDLASFLWIVTEDDPWCLVLRPRGKVYEPCVDADRKTSRMVEAWNEHPDRDAWKELFGRSMQPKTPVCFEPDPDPARDCPAYRGTIREHHRCAANDLPPWEKFEDYPPDEPGVTTCRHCNWVPVRQQAMGAVR